MGLVDTLIGVDWENVDLTAIYSDKAFLKVAAERVENALKSPFLVTSSVYKTHTHSGD